MCKGTVTADEITLLYYLVVDKIKIMKTLKWFTEFKKALIDKLKADKIQFIESNCSCGHNHEKDIKASINYLKTNETNNN